MITTETDFETRYLSGASLYGDDFTQAEIEAWYDDEREGYANLGDSAEDATTGIGYGYHAFNIRHMLRFLPPGPIGDALGIGAAYGQELAPISDRLTSVTILEPSVTLRAAEVGGLPIKYVDPVPSGIMPFDDASFDLVTCYGVLHHIPNVSLVVSEIARVLRPGRYATIREPIHSMGDWRRPRQGLTKRERGIPRKILQGLMDEHFETVHTSLCDFPLRGRAKNPESTVNILADQAFARMFAWNYRYHASASWQKVRPRSLAMVLKRK